MKKIILSAVAAAMILVSCKEAEDKAIDRTTSPSDTTVVAEIAVETPMDSVAMMKAWEEYMLPGDVHKMFAAEEGTWHEDMTMWLSANDQNPTKTHLMAENRMILGGRYQEIKHTGTLMGMPFEGISTTGYDNAANKVVSTWIDNMGTGIMTMRGSFDGNAKVISLKGEIVDPMTGKIKPVRETYTIVDNDTRKLEMFDLGPNNKEYKSMEIIMKRSK